MGYVEDILGSKILMSAFICDYSDNTANENSTAKTDYNI